MNRLIVVVALIAGIARAGTFEEDKIAPLPEPLRTKVTAQGQSQAAWRDFWSFYLSAVCQPLIDQGTKTVTLEKQKASVAGVENKPVLYAAQEQVVAGNKCAEQAKEILKQHKVAALATGRPELKKVATCVQGPESEDAWCRLMQLFSSDAPTRETWLAEVQAQ